MTNQMEKFKGFMSKAQGSFESVATKHLNAEKIVRLANLSAMRNPTLLECAPSTILNCVAACCQIGLEFDSPLQHAHLIPYKNKKAGKTECQLIIGYRGYIELARRSGNIKSIEAHVVYKGDKFEVQFGLEPKLTHVPSWDSKRLDSDIIAAYAVCHFIEGGYQFEVLTKNEIEHAKASSKTNRFGPWVDHYAEMARKTCIRKLSKYLPLTPEAAAAEEFDKSNHTGAHTIQVRDEETGMELFPEDFGEVIEGEAEKKETKANAVLDKLN